MKAIMSDMAFDVGMATKHNKMKTHRRSISKLKNKHYNKYSQQKPQRATLGLVPHLGAAGVHPLPGVRGPAQVLGVDEHHAGPRDRRGRGGGGASRD